MPELTALFRRSMFPLFSPSLPRSELNNNKFGSTSGIGSLMFDSNTHLESLRLDGNALAGSIPAFTGTTHLTSVLLNNNSFTGSIPASYVALTSLVTLDVSNNKLTGSVPALTATSLVSMFVPSSLRCSTVLQLRSAPHCSTAQVLTSFFFRFGSYHH